MIASTIALFTLPFAMLVHAIPFPDELPPGELPPGDQCNPSCTFFCWKLTLHTLMISGTENSAFSGSQTLSVNYDGVDVCPEQHHECFDCGTQTCKLRCPSVPVQYRSTTLLLPPSP
jgi:hypothetical protein